LSLDELLISVLETLRFGRLFWFYCLEVLDHFQSSGIEPAPIACLLLASGLPEAYHSSPACAAILEATGRAVTVMAATGSSPNTLALVNSRVLEH